MSIGHFLYVSTSFHVQNASRQRNNNTNVNLSRTSKNDWLCPSEGSVGNYLLSAIQRWRLEQLRCFWTKITGWSLCWFLMLLTNNTNFYFCCAGCRKGLTEIQICAQIYTQSRSSSSNSKLHSTACNFADTAISNSAHAEYKLIIILWTTHYFVDKIFAM